MVGFSDTERRPTTRRDYRFLFNCEMFSSALSFLVSVTTLWTTLEAYQNSVGDSFKPSYINLENLIFPSQERRASSSAASLMHFDSSAQFWCHNEIFISTNMAGLNDAIFVFPTLSLIKFHLLKTRGWGEWRLKHSLGSNLYSGCFWERPIAAWPLWWWLYTKRPIIRILAPQ